MHADLIGYLTGTLDEPARGRFEGLLREDGNLRRQLALARRRLEPLRADVVVEAPPPGLVFKTLAFVAEHACKDLPVAPPTKVAAISARAALETTMGRVAYERPWWRRVDVVVAASIAVTVIGLLLPALLHLRVLGVQTQCENNLRELWQGLNAYQAHHQTLPEPKPVAGMVIPILRDAGVLSSQLVACCPGAADGAACLNVSVHELASMPPRDFERAAPKLLPGYAYSLGFRDDAGRLHGPAATLPDVAAAQMPILADAPGAPIAFGNSANHSGRGQNILFTDGHVSFATWRTAGLKQNDDIYLNQANKVAAGLGAHDIVLGTGAAMP